MLVIVWFICLFALLHWSHEDLVRLLTVGQRVLQFFMTIRAAMSLKSV